MYKPRRNSILALMLSATLTVGVSAQEVMPPVEVAAPAAAPANATAPMPGPLGAGRSLWRDAAAPPPPPGIERGSFTAGRYGVKSSPVRPGEIGETIWLQGLSPSEKKKVEQNYERYEKAKRAEQKARLALMRQEKLLKGSSEKLAEKKSAAKAAQVALDKAQRKASELKQEIEKTKKEIARTEELEKGGGSEYQAARRELKKLRPLLDKGGDLTPAEREKWEQANARWQAALDKRRGATSDKKKLNDDLQRLKQQLKQTETGEEQRLLNKANKELAEQTRLHQKVKNKHTRAASAHQKTLTEMHEADKIWQDTLEIVKRRDEALPKYIKAEKRLDSLAQALKESQNDLRQAIKEFRKRDRDIKGRKAASQGMQKVLGVSKWMTRYVGFRSGVSVDATGALGNGQMALELAEAIILPDLKKLKKDDEGLYTLEGVSMSHIEAWASAANKVKIETETTRSLVLSHLKAKREYEKASSEWRLSGEVTIPSK